MRRTTFLCELPPPFGGVTVKNQLILDAVVKDSNQVQVIDFFEIKRRPLRSVSILAKMLLSFIRKDTIVYGFGSPERLKPALRLQKIFGGKRSLDRTTNVVMGGRFQEYLRKDSGLLRRFSEVKSNLVETEGMKAALVELGLKNCHVFPNARTTVAAREPAACGKPLRCVFFSKICAEKGVDYILSELADAEGITIDFYGPIENGIKKQLDQFLKEHSFARYHGVFDPAKADVYAELNGYDVLLLPTKWKGEGVPGILVESKMAGITAVVSNNSYNSEIVLDGVEGIVLPDLEPGTLLRTLKGLNADQNRLMRLKQGAYHSRTRYAMESYSELLKSAFGL